MSYKFFFDSVKHNAKSINRTIEDVVYEAGLTIGSYNSYRRNGKYPRADEAYRIAKIFKTTVEDLVVGEDIIIKNEYQLLRAYRALNDNGREIIIAAAQGLIKTFPK